MQILPALKKIRLCQHLAAKVWTGPPKMIRWLAHATLYEHSKLDNLKWHPNSIQKWTIQMTVNMSYIIKDSTSGPHDVISFGSNLVSCSAMHLKLVT